MKMTAFINLVTEQYRASEALVLPVDAQAARAAPIMWAWVKAADMPLSLKLPDGFIPSYCKNSRPGSKPTYFPTALAGWSRVCPSPMLTTFSAGAKGSNSWNRQTPPKLSGSYRRDHLSSKNFQLAGGRKRDQS